MRALALAGIATPGFSVMTTLTLVPSGVTEFTVPTGTPSTRTVEPGYTPMVSAKYAVICLAGLTRCSTSTPPTISATATTPAPIPMSQFLPIMALSRFRGLAADRRGVSRRVRVGNQAAQVDVEPAAVAERVAEQ